MSLLLHFRKLPRELKLFIFASILIGLAFNIYDSTFNNFLNSKFSISGFQRSFLEVPREIPGFLVVFISALLWFLCSRRLAGLAMLFGAAGSWLAGYFSPTFGIMSIWIFTYSVGNHIWMPLSSAIGMELADKGHVGTRLGQLNSLRNFAAIIGSFVVFLGFKYLKFTFNITFTITAILLCLAAILFFRMEPKPRHKQGSFLVVHKEYNLYYFLSILFGSRKQIFITFAPWVLVTIFKQPTQTMATLLMVGGIIGIFFQPLLGKMIDTLGEKKVLEAESVALVFVCLAYGFARFILPEKTALIVTFVCFLVDQVLMSVNMARATYMNKIALSPEDVQPALTFSVTIDHVFSISIALVGGLIWNTFGYQYVFLIGVLIAVINFFAARRINIPEQHKPALAQITVRDISSSDS
ncbi:MAG: MFS transporter [Anaerolinea sp.]|nr:MFS transporter [Anaerolinea sp.]